MLKMVKVQVNLEVKGNTEDEDDFRDRVYDKLQLLIESEELEFTFEEDEDDGFELED